MSFLKIILIAICLPLISSQDLCQLIAPNGSYKGLGIYKRYNFSEPIYAFFRDYWMYNKQGIEWKVIFGINETNDVRIEVDYQSIQAINTSIVKRLGLFVTPKFDVWPYIVLHCDFIRSKGEANDLKVNCRDTYSGSHIKVRDVNDWLDSIFINQDDPLESHFISVNKKNKTITKYLYYDDTLEDIIAVPCYIVYLETCPIIKFIEQMDDSLFRQIESIDEYSQTSVNSPRLFQCFDMVNLESVK